MSNTGPAYAGSSVHTPSRSSLQSCNDTITNQPCEYHRIEMQVRVALLTAILSINNCADEKTRFHFRTARFSAGVLRYSHWKL